MSTLTITQALVNWFSEPVTNLPRELRPIAEAYISQWSSLSPDERRARAKEVDRQRVVKAGIKLSLAEYQQERDRHVPLKFAEETIGFWDGKAAMSASFWLAQPSVTPHQAALILCQYNPTKLDGADLEFGSTDENRPVDYSQLFLAFDAVQKVAPLHRTLSEWLNYAKHRHLKYHPWIDEYVLAVGTLRVAQGAAAVPPAELTKPSKQSATRTVSTGDPLPVSRAAATSEVRTTAIGESDWELRKPSRYQGYRWPLYVVVKAAHVAGLAPPTALDVIGAFKLKLPPEIITVMPDEIIYRDKDGIAKSASLRAISKTIARLVVKAPDSPDSRRLARLYMKIDA